MNPDFDKPLLSHDLLFARAAAATAIATGCLDQIGWAFHIRVLTQISSGFPTMKPLTGLCFILVGCAVVFLARQPMVSQDSALNGTGSFQRIPAGLALIVLAISVATGLEYAGFTTSAVDLFLFRSAVILENGVHPGRMSIATTTSFSMLSISILLLAASKRQSAAWHQLTAFVSNAIGLVGILGFVYGAGTPNKFAPFDTMALHTAVVTFLLSLSIFFVRPLSGIMATFNSPHLGGFLARRTLPIALTLPFFLGWLRLRGERAGYYGMEFGLAIFACANTMLFGILLWWTSRSLNLMDAQRSQIAMFEERRREILESIAEGNSLRSILESIVLLVETQESRVRCSILLFDSETGTLTAGAAPHLPEAYNRAIDGISIGPEVGSCGTAAYFGKRIVVEDIGPHPFWKNYKELALEHGLRSCWSTPIFSPSKEILGTFAIYRGEPGPPQESEFAWVDSATDLAAIAIQKRKSEEALQTNEAQLRFLFDNASLGIALVSPSGRNIECNPAFCEMLGYTAAELKSILFSNITHIEDVAEEAARLDALMADRAASYQVQKRYIHKSGKIIHANLNVSIVRNASGAPLYGIHMAEDITLRHLAEQESAKLQAQLQQSQRMQSLGTLAGGIAHDFNNILASIIGNVEFAAEGLPEPHQSQPHLARISEAAVRATELVRQILAFSRLQSVQRRPVKLGQVIGEATKLLRSTLPAMIEIRVELDPTTPQILADPTQVHQILMNLGTNAAHAMARHGGVLSVALSRVALEDSDVTGLRAGLHARLVVSDTGMGMNAATVARAFEPFFTTKPQGQGTGLGLAVVHGIVSSYCGAIQAKSAPGIGTSFDLYFPAAPEAPETKPIVDTRTRRGAGEHILLIDDEAAVAEVTRHQLEKIGYRVTAFQDSSQALAAFAANPKSFDAVLSDLSMPFICGLEVIPAIRGFRPEMPVVLASGFFQNSDHETAKNLGITEFLTKPFSSSMLANTFARVFAATPAAVPPGD